jgi:uncharacterized protein (DUF58 family)
MADADRTLFGRAMTASGALPDLMVAADRVASTVVQGVHGRRRVGQGDSFWQFRRYQPGDSTQRIDWRQSAKNRAVFIRETEWEAAASVWLWRDASPSMRYASSDNLPQKSERAELVLLALSALLTGGGERVALLGGGERPVTGRAVLRRFAETLMMERQSDGARSPSLPARVPLPTWGNVVLIGDFLDPIEDIESLVRFYAGMGVLGHIVQVLDPVEETLPYAGHVKFSGLENEGIHPIRRVEAVRNDYLHRLQAQQEGLARIARAVGWTLHLHRTDKPPQTLLLSLYMAMAQPRNGVARGVI